MESNEIKTPASVFNRMIAAVLAAEAAGEDSRILEALRSPLWTAILAAPHGANGSAFITNQGTSHGSQTRVIGLRINGRLRATVTIGRHRDDRGWLVVLPVAEAEAAYRAERQAGRDAEVAYQSRLAELVADLHAANHRQLADFGVWRYWDGQEGGCFERFTPSSPESWDGTRETVSAPGAMRAAWGENWGEAYAADAAWEAGIDARLNDDEELERLVR